MYRAGMSMYGNFMMSLETCFLHGGRLGHREMDKIADFMR